ncbi:MAG: hypothetical protein Q8922_13230 [Bacteroidota bacterium]|nr:hypothetical protein [Bacteroidota bacterium]MDP4232782.1 hypothetical protein [Bacteroidota bacterium]MDP4242536.1 hypothetical protein [Bacteroidota bacterium]MDP4288885.1 hypothetical protein [Bacteroidota bacterium]
MTIRTQLGAPALSAGVPLDSMRIRRLTSLWSASSMLAGLLAVFTLVLCTSSDSSARLVPKGKKGSSTPLSFRRQLNVYSNMSFYYTNSGMLFYAGNGNDEGLFWPRGSGDSYIFGGGIWFATKKQIQGKRRKLCDLGYNPNSGAGWYVEGEKAAVDGGGKTATDQTNYDSKYISYVSPRYDKTTGKFISGSSTVVPPPYCAWPLWDTATGKTLFRNFYFGDYISDVSMRDLATLQKIKPTAKPAIVSEEDIVNLYTDADTKNNPEFREGQGYPFGIDVQEVVYSWSFGRYRDMVFVRYRIINSSSDSLLDCWIAPAFDVDLGTADGGAGNDFNSYVSDAVATTNANVSDLAQLREPYHTHPSALNMAYQYRTAPYKGQAHGMLGMSFLESPVKGPNGNIIPNDDSAALNGYYGSKSLFQTNQQGLVTFRAWNINNDPATQDLRYDFVSAGSRDVAAATANDQRMCMGTGPFTLPPGQHVETTVAFTVARVSPTDARANFGALLQLTDFAHQVFGEPKVLDSTITKDTNGAFDTNYVAVVDHFLSPVPPSLPTITTKSLDRAVLVTWDSTAEKSFDYVTGLHNITRDTIFVPQLRRSVTKLDTTLPFLGYQLWRSTRSDHDSTIRPDGINPDVLLKQWQLYDFATDSVFAIDTFGLYSSTLHKWTRIDSLQAHFSHWHYRRKNSTPHDIPHHYLDVGDDNHDGVINGSEGLLNGVRYYYYLVAYDEFDSINQVGPLFTAIVPDKNFVQEIPSKPPFIAHFADNASNDLANNCMAGGLEDVRLDIIDSGRFLSVYTNDEIDVAFQPRWAEYGPAALFKSYLQEWVDVTDTKNGLDNTYARMHNPPASTEGYNFPQVSPRLPIVVKQKLGQVLPDTTFSSAFTTDNSAFAPQQTIDRTFRVLADLTFTQDSAGYSLDGVSASAGVDTSIMSMSLRTALLSDNYGAISNATKGNTRPSFMGALGNVAYEVSFDNFQQTPATVAPVPHDLAPSQKVSFVAPTITDTKHNVTFSPQVLPLHVRIAGCPSAELRHIEDSLINYTIEYNGLYYKDTFGSAGFVYPWFNDPNHAHPADPDTMKVPNPGWYEMDAYHYDDANPFTTNHTSPTLIATTVGPFYWPIDVPVSGGFDTSGNMNGGYNHLVVHRLKVAGAEIIFNAPEAKSDLQTGGRTTLGTPHLRDFQPGDKVTLAFSGITKNLPFPGAKFRILTTGGSTVDAANASLYTQNVLDQVQVVPNPYVVTHLGQTSTDNAKLFFTRLPPRATIEIYALDGTLINTLEHYGYQDSVYQDPGNPAQTTTTYFYNRGPGDRNSVEEWNLLTSGRQRIGSQVLIARVIAKDPNNNDAVIGETTTKFAVVVGISK